MQVGLFEKRRLIWVAVKQKSMITKTRFSQMIGKGCKYILDLAHLP